MRIAVIGAGPAGCYFAHLASASGAKVFLFDHQAPKDKACGGGITAKAIWEFPFLAELICPHISIKEAVFISPYDLPVQIKLDYPVLIFSRIDLNRALLGMAVSDGVTFLKQQVLDFQELGTGWQIMTSRETLQADILVGADGINGLTRRKFIGALPQSSTMIATGYYLENFAEKSVTIKLLPDLPGYIWVFPGPSYTSIGLGLPLGCLKSKNMLQRIKAFMEVHFPLACLNKSRIFAGLIPSIKDPSVFNHLLSGENWALLGDAAALADPISGEGIYYALKSAQLLSGILAKERKVKAYTEEIQKELIPELRTASQYSHWFFNPRFTHKMIQLSYSHQGINKVLVNLIEGSQGYTTLKQRLIKEKFSTLFDLIRFAYLRI